MNDKPDAAEHSGSTDCSPVRVKIMMLFANGSIAAFDENDEQITALQMRSAIELWAEYAAGSGFDVDRCEFRTQAPGGDGIRGHIVADFDGFLEVYD